VAEKFHFTILRREVTRASRGLSAMTELLVNNNYKCGPMPNVMAALPNIGGAL